MIYCDIYIVPLHSGKKSINTTTHSHEYYSMNREYCRSSLVHLLDGEMGSHFQNNYAMCIAPFAVFSLKYRLVDISLDFFYGF